MKTTVKAGGCNSYAIALLVLLGLMRLLMLSPALLLHVEAKERPVANATVARCVGKLRYQDTQYTVKSVYHCFVLGCRSSSALALKTLGNGRSTPGPNTFCLCCLQVHAKWT